MYLPLGKSSGHCPKEIISWGTPEEKIMYWFQESQWTQQKVITEGKTKGQISIHPLTKIDKMCAKLKGAKVFSTIDLRSGVYHIASDKDSRAKTACAMPFGKYKFLMVPFHLALAPAYFQLFMNQVLEVLDFPKT